MKVVVVDRRCLPEGVEFPPLAAPKYGWEEYPALDAEGIAERCWRTDIVVALDTAIETSLLERMPKLGLLVLVGNACAGWAADTMAGATAVLRYPDVDIRDAAQAQVCCNAIAAAIDRHVAGAGR